MCYGSDERCPVPGIGRGPVPPSEFRWSCPDVGPVTRQSLTRPDDFFGELVCLTLGNKLIRGQVPE
jgi:hypothetical protein